jgi:hypothetical protein
MYLHRKYIGNYYLHRKLLSTHTQAMGDRPVEVMVSVANIIGSAIFFWGWGYVIARRFVPIHIYLHTHTRSE